MDKITLTEEKETLLIPLLGKARENEKDNPIIIDKKAAEIVSNIDYDFDSLKVPEKTNIMMCIRAKIMDDLVEKYLCKESENNIDNKFSRDVVLHLGCGLDSRYLRIIHKNLDWYDLDFPDVIEIRKNFYKETANYHMIPSSVTDYQWIELIPEDREKYIVVAEGFFMYLKEEEIKELLDLLQKRLGEYILIFDAYSVLTAKNARNHPSLKKTGAVIQWGINNPDDITKWGEIEFLDEIFFTDSKYLENQDLSTRAMFKIAGLFSAARKAHRLLVYKVGEERTS